MLHAQNLIEEKKIEKIPSTTMTVKMAFTTEEVTRRPSDLAEPSTSRPSTDAMRPMTSAMNGALIRPTKKVAEIDRTLQPRHEAFGADAAIAPGDEHPAEKRRDIGDEGQERQSEHQSDEARHDQHIDRIEAHHAQRIDLLAHFHRAQFGRDRRAGAAGDHDRGEKHAQFAQRQNADEIDRISRRAEAFQQIDAALGDDAADEKIDERDDRHAAEGEGFEVKDDGSAAKPRRRNNAPAERRNDAAEKFDPLEDIAAGIDNALAHVFENDARIKPLVLRRRGKASVMRLGEQNFIFGLEVFDSRLDAMPAEVLARAIDEPGP